MAEQQHTPRLDSLMGSAQEAPAFIAHEPAFELPYTAPDHRPNPERELFDVLRGVLFGGAALLLLATSLAYSFGLGGRTQVSLLGTGLVHTVLWPLTAIFLLFSAVFALRPDQLSARRQRAVAIYAIAATALMACAITLAAGFLATAAAVLSACAAVLAIYGVHQLNQYTARSRWEHLATDAPLSFLAGFSLVYTLQLWFAVIGWNDREHAVPVTLVVVAFALLAAGLAHTERGRHALASGFGICLIAAACQGWFTGTTPLWASALWIFMALLVFLLAENRRFQISHAEHRAQRGKSVEF